MVQHSAEQTLVADGDRLERRAKIAALEQHMASLDEQVEPEMRHYFASGVYVREMRMAAGTLAVGKIHKSEHIFILLVGRMTVTTEDGSQTIEGPLTLVSQPGTKRVAYAHTDCVLQNIHAVGEERDLEKIEAMFIAPSFEAIEADQNAALITGVA